MQSMEGYSWSMGDCYRKGGRYIAWKQNMDLSFCSIFASLIWLGYDEWTAVSEATPESLNPSVLDEEEEGLPSPPLDDLAFFYPQMELSEVRNSNFVTWYLFRDCFLTGLVDVPSSLTGWTSMEVSWIVNLLLFASLLNSQLMYLDSLFSIISDPGRTEKQSVPKCKPTNVPIMVHTNEGERKMKKKQATVVKPIKPSSAPGRRIKLNKERKLQTEPKRPHQHQSVSGRKTFHWLN